MRRERKERKCVYENYVVLMVDFFEAFLENNKDNKCVF